jgi:ferric-dicitrate binding protein FerR (iron transport regulator)
MPSRPKGQRPIDERIHDVLSGRADPEDEVAVRDWRAASADNERTFRTCVRIFEIERAQGQRIDVGEPPDVRDVVWLAEAREPARKLTGLHPDRAGRGWWRAWVAAAAGAGQAGGAGVTVFDPAAGPPEARRPGDMFLAGDQDPVTMRLTDGSIVRVAPGGQVRLLPGSGRRLV